MKRKITVLLVMLFALIINTQAQQGQGGARRSPEEMSKMMAQRLTDSLKLTADQQKAVESVFLTSRQAQDKLRAGLAPGTRPEKADMDKINNTRDEGLKKVLTPDQFKKYKDDMEANMARRQRPAGN